jgi:hypothetical protein
MCYIDSIGCGAPIGSMLGNVHANRVSADAGMYTHINVFM